jgi:excisionase family DNA binding protein
MTIQEAAHRLNKSDLTIRRWIKSGKLTATMINNKWDITESALNNISEDLSDDISSVNHNNAVDKVHLLEEIRFLRKENEQLHQQIEEKDRILEDSRQRQDMIIMQLSRQLDNQLKLLEYNNKVPWYRKWLKKKSLLNAET